MLFPTLPYILTLWLHPHTHSQSQEQVGGSPLRAASPLPAYARAPRGSRSPRKPAQGTQEPLAPAASAPGAGAPAAPCARAAAPGAEAFSGSLGDAATVWQVPGLTSPPARAEQQEYAADPVWGAGGDRAWGAAWLPERRERGTRAMWAGEGEGASEPRLLAEREEFAAGAAWSGAAGAAPLSEPARQPGGAGGRADGGGAAAPRSASAAARPPGAEGSPAAGPADAAALARALLTHLAAAAGQPGQGLAAQQGVAAGTWLGAGPPAHAAYPGATPATLQAWGWPGPAAPPPGRAAPSAGSGPSHPTPAPDAGLVAMLQALLQALSPAAAGGGASPQYERAPAPHTGPTPVPGPGAGVGSPARSPAGARGALCASAAARHAAALRSIQSLIRRPCAGRPRAASAAPESSPRRSAPRARPQSCGEAASGLSDASAQTALDGGTGGWPQPAAGLLTVGDAQRGDQTPGSRRGGAAAADGCTRQRPGAGSGFADCQPQREPACGMRYGRSPARDELGAAARGPAPAARSGDPAHTGWAARPDPTHSGAGPGGSASQPHARRPVDVHFNPLYHSDEGGDAGGSGWPASPPSTESYSGWPPAAASGREGGGASLPAGGAPPAAAGAALADALAAADVSESLRRELLALLQRNLADVAVRGPVQVRVTLWPACRAPCVTLTLSQAAQPCGVSRRLSMRPATHGGAEHPHPLQCDRQRRVAVRMRTACRASPACRAEKHCMRCASSPVAERPALAHLCSPSDLAGRPLNLSTNSGINFRQALVLERSHVGGTSQPVELQSLTSS